MGVGVTRPKMETVSAAAGTALNILNIQLQPENNVLTAVPILRGTVMKVVRLMKCWLMSNYVHFPARESNVGDLRQKLLGHHGGTAGWRPWGCLAPLHCHQCARAGTRGEGEKWGFRAWIKNSLLESELFLVTGYQLPSPYRLHVTGETVVPFGTWLNR